MGACAALEEKGYVYENGKLSAGRLFYCGGWVELDWNGRQKFMRVRRNQKLNRAEGGLVHFH